MQQDTGIDPDSLRVLSMLSEKQRDCALTLYANREKKKSLAYVFWIVGAVYYFYLDRPRGIPSSGSSGSSSSASSGGSSTSSTSAAWSKNGTKKSSKNACVKPSASTPTP